MSEPMLK